MIRFNANLFRIAFSCASREKTRYYLQAVYVEPHAVRGVTLTATNGVKMICIHDEDGRADEPAIINLGDTLKLCKAKRGYVRVVVIETGASDATIFEAKEPATETDFNRIAIAPRVRVDGSFPDYRRVIPTVFRNSMAPAFASQHAAELVAVGAELAEHFFAGFKAKEPNVTERKDCFQLSAADNDAPEGSPALFAWAMIPQAFAILMPTRNKGNAAVLPTWFTGESALVAQAAE
jgi:DNA polymerase III sliding clamp (beta) subunit (PCNA family)